MINFIFAFLIVKISNYLEQEKIGLLWLVGMPLWLFIVVGLCVLDLIVAWLAHYLEHKIKWICMFHLIHHSDPKVDTTIANRHHPGEPVIRVGFYHVRCSRTRLTNLDCR